MSSSYKQKAFEILGSLLKRSGFIFDKERCTLTELQREWFPQCPLTLDVMAVKTFKIHMDSYGRLIEGMISIEEQIRIPDIQHYWFSIKIKGRNDLLHYQAGTGHHRFSA